MQDKLEFIKSNNFDDISKPLAITYDNLFLENENTRNLITTLETQNWDYSIIRISPVYRNHGDKIKGYLEFLKTLPGDKIVTLMDSRDVFCLRDSRHFIPIFKLFKYDIIISLEIWADTELGVVTSRVNQCEPLVNYWNHHRVHSWPNRRYVNSGLIVGKVSELIKMFSFCEKNIELSAGSDDQTLVGIYMNEFPGEIYGDFEADILHTSTFAKGGGSIKMKVQNYDSPKFGDLLGKGAFFLHFPSMRTKGQTLMYETTKKLLIDDEFNSYKINSLYGYTEDIFGSDSY